MKVEFAPINIPLKRRMQTVAVLQWIFSFLLLGNSLPPSCPWPREKRGKNGFLSNQRHPWALVCVTLWFHVGAEVAGWQVASRLSPGGQEHRTSGLELSLPCKLWMAVSLFSAFVSFYRFFFKYGLKKLVPVSSH